jgi:DNA polymerase-3 subunit gamma/tau
VLPTIRSRTQHFEFRLLGGDVLGDLLSDVNQAAGLGVAPEAIEMVVRRGRGSARDALSVLDQVAAAGEVEDEAPVTDETVDALCERDAARALVAVAQACAAGRDPRRLAADLVEHLHQAFLLTQAPGLVALPDQTRDRLAEQAHRMGPAALVRAIETLGQAQVEMREALDPRITLDTALVRLARPEADASPAALLERLERLERQLRAQQGAEGAAPAGPAPAPSSRPAASTGPGGAAASRPAPSAGPGGSSRPGGSTRPPAPPIPGRRVPPIPKGPAPAATGPGGPPSTGEAPSPALPEAGGRTPPVPPTRPGVDDAAALPSRDALTKAWGDDVLGSLSGRAKARFGAGRFLAVEDGRAVFGLPNEHYLGRCQEVRAEVETALAQHFGIAVPLRLVVEPPGWGPAVGPPGGGPTPPPEDDPADFELGGEVSDSDAPAAVTSPEERLKRAFPGAEEVSP